jgi:predicted flap endonuclease-1-like 5' DNA nuclease
MLCCIAQRRLRPGRPGGEDIAMTLASPLDSTLDPSAEKALRLPVGLTSPLWFMIGSAAMMGAAVFWATRWVKPVVADPQIRSLPAPEPEVQAAMEKALSVAEATADLIVETVVESVEALTPDAGLEVVIDPVVGEPVLVATSEAVEAPAVEPLAAADLPADDLTVLTGIGPKLCAALAERGVTRFAQIAAWTEEEIAVLDKEMKLMGRIARDSWVDQAKKLIG